MFPIVLTAVLGAIALVGVVYAYITDPGCKHLDCIPLEYAVMDGDIVVLIDECVACRTPIARTS